MRKMIILVILWTVLLISKIHDYLNKNITDFLDNFPLRADKNNSKLNVLIVIVTKWQSGNQHINFIVKLAIC